MASFDLQGAFQRARQLAAAGVRGRYAPSPTGELHPGNLRTALLAWLQARLAGGRFVLRMEDLDRPRTRPGCADLILEQLAWLGLEWDEGPDNGGPVGPYVQSARDEIYEAALSRLHEQGLLFACYCSRKDIAQAAGAPHGRPGIYPGTCRNGSPAAEPGGRPPPSWRYRVGVGKASVWDELAGWVQQDMRTEMGDFVLRRSDRLFAYQLAVVVDDALMGITDVLRGADLLDSTPRQRVLYEALGWPVPRFWHVPLLRDREGNRMAKRDGSVSLSRLREQGQSPADVVGDLAAGLGLVPEGASCSAGELLQSLSLETLRQKLAAALRADLRRADS
ncbi:MAG TPA: tRNA glutamyl-Q(34) synthetase GluQRS [Gammaproteobacteria bacterium]|nr:tRNA glutamyl-Q(34) synthetase GluQRS [Gammaproteobacteria bacterium]